MVFVCGDSALDAAEWDAYVDAWARVRPDEAGARSLVYAKSAQPSPVQRDKLNKAIAEISAAGKLKSAVLTESMLVRTVITAMQWFHRDTFRVFAPSDLPAALRFLTLDTTESEQANTELNRLRALLIGTGVAPRRAS
jgi:hypothetical protein